ncbi:FHA domain-containing protein [Pseudoduganella namucuonensis]|uniref:Type III secretion protein D n=1 Tax=Pseudoduganella namucuonensis TaxID=1035707 RepID=A0A1I7LWF9_9BURK|nr:FHA domain-containing protein [Pseudoduganella namucuonensis]SFV13920.1 type III secretion protein D [Pseudoduganella namucuonensis]
MFELRILNGLHRGATLPLDEHTLVIGADDDADVVLVDPGIETRHATLAPGPQGWTLSTLDGAVLGTEHNRPFAALELRDGDFARLGHVWLCVAGQDAPWENPPPEPAQGDGAMDNDGQPAPQSAPLAADADGPDGYEPYSDSPLDDPQHAPHAAATAPEPMPAAPPAQASAAAEPAAKAAKAKAAPAKAVKARPARGAGWRRWKMLLVPTVLVTILSACAAYSIKSRPEHEAAPAASSIPAPRGAGPAAEQAATLPGALPDGQPAALPPGPPPAQASAPERKASPQELRDAFRTRLKEVDLLKRFNLDLRDGEWTMQASLDAEEAARFDRILKAFVQTHNIKFPVHARVGGAEVMLPFRVREVISGANASIVTQDGKRLYVGDEHKGLRLVAVDGHHLQFDGERKIKVKW